MSHPNDKPAGSEFSVAADLQSAGPAQGLPDKAPGTFDDPRVIQALEEYRTALDAGLKPNRRAFQERYPEIADALAGCLAALEFVHSAAPGLSQAGPSQGKQAGADQITGVLGDFRLLREIGRGGMGVVYEAEQISLGRQVALKVLPFASTLDPKQLQRFKSEAHAAACLHHTNIVPVYATGCERSVHYYAMQFIDGQTLAAVIEGLRKQTGLATTAETDPATNARVPVVNELLSGRWTAPSKDRKSAQPETGTALFPAGASHQPDALARDGQSTHAPDAPARDDHRTPHHKTADSTTLSVSSQHSTRNAAFFRSVAHLGIQAAEALEHAHESGVIHRDVKPANLLVDMSGNLWITDFGLVQLKSQPGMTMTGDLVGTLRYMSPEQALAKRVVVDHRTDIYSLGATLYELLTLEPAVPGRDRQEILRRIAFDEPRRPGRINTAIPAELETIVGKAMEKKPEERYGTAQELADDLRRYLEDKPIRAKRPTLWHRARKLARRHPGMAWMAAGLLAVLAIGASVSTSLIARQLARAELAEKSLKVEFDRAVEATKTAQENLKKAQRAERDRTDQLWRAKLAQAQAGRFSGRAGRAFDGLKVLGQAAQIARSLNVPHEDLVKIRNEAIACMALPDLRPIKEWEKYTPGGAFENREKSDLEGAGAILDPCAKRYTTSDDQGNITIRRMADDQAIVRLDGPGVAVRFAAFSPDGQFLGATYPGRVLIWDLARGRVVFRLTPEIATVPVLEWSPDGRRFAVHGQAGTVVLYDVDARRELTRFSVNGTFSRVAFHPNSKQLAIASKSVQIWDVETGRPVTQFTTPLPPGQDFAWGAGGRFLALIRGDHGHHPDDWHIYLWDVVEGRMHKVLKGHMSTVLRVAFNHAGDLLASTSWDNTIRLWNLWTGEELVRAAGGWGGRIEFSPDDRFLSLSVAWSSARRWWEIKSPREYRTFGTTMRQIGRVDFSGDGRLLTSGAGASVAFWDVTTGAQVASLPCPGGSFCFAAPQSFPSPSPTEEARDPVRGRARHVSVDGAARFDSLFVGSALGLYRWPLSNDRDELGRKLRIGPAVRLAPLNLYPSALSPDGRALLADKDSRSIFLVNLEDPKSTRILIPDTSGISGYVLSPDGRWLATGSFNGSGAKVWDAHSGKLVRHLATAPSAGVCFSPDGNWLVTAANSVYQFWRVGSWQSGLKIPNADLVAMTFSPDSKLLAVARSIWEIQLVDVASGREVATLTSPQPFWNSNLRFSRDGSLLALAGRSNQGIGLWNLRAIRRQLAELKLDWDQPAYPPAAMGESADRPGLLKPLRVQLDWGEFDDGSIQSLLIAFFPFHAEAYYQRGVIWAKHGDRAEALANLDMAATLRPGHAETFFERGLIHAREARFQEAVADFSQTLALKPAHTEARGERAWAFLGLEQADKAVADFSQALARRPDDWDLWFGLGKVHGQLQRWSEAAEAFSKAAAHRPEFWPAWCFQAEASINLADWKTAVNGFSKALQRGDGSRTSVSRFLAYTLPSLRSRYVGVANDINTVLLPEAQILGRRGLARARAGQWEEAETDFAKAAKLDPGLIDVPYSHALAFLANSDLAGYRRVCAKMLDHFGQTNDPRTAHRAAWIAVLAPDAVKDWQQAVNLARKALAADPKNNDCAATLGAALYRTGRFQEAIPHLERAAAGREPAAPAAHSAAYAVFFLAMAHQRLGHSALASQWLKRALKRGQEVVQSDSKASPPWDWRLVFELLQRETEAVVIARASCSQGGLHELCPSAYFGTPVWVWPRLSAYALRQHFFDLLTPWLGLPTGA